MHTGAKSLLSCYCIKYVLCWDDIYTTGVTLEEAARVLHRAGAAQIIGWVIASGAR